MTPEVIAYLMHGEREDGPVFLDELAHRPQWQAFAACRDAPSEWFFPVRGGDVRRAKALCDTCVVRGECLDYAMSDGEIRGLWAGTTERERARMRRIAG
ncbi:MAG TPA: WhiB family transcriptional regulator [Acidimicrobiales bacterium]|nr:WhiB family transcriptional regulator [Acidimicrobiales bacterium]